MRLYLLRSDNVLCSYMGMTEETILSMLEEQGLTGEFISEAQFQTRLQAES